MGEVVAHLGDIECKVENASVRWLELPFAELSMLSCLLPNNSPAKLSGKNTFLVFVWITKQS
jgi:hypothetical protein